MESAIFSLIVPTRGRKEQMQRFLNSLRINTTWPKATEVIIVVDEDDEESKSITCDGLVTRLVVVPPKSTMGALNMAGFRASRGQYIMLMNDDVVVRTAGWDEKALDAFRSFPDEIVLVHTNDGIFGDKLCTFPFLTRRFCEFTSGICPEIYNRYRIDDHIYNIFNLLATLGHKRICYLPDVLFEHHNLVENQDGQMEYIPDPKIHSEDTKSFDHLFDDRKSIAVDLANWIEHHRRSQVTKVRHKILAGYKDAVAMRLPDHVRTLVQGRPAGNRARVTIGVVSANIDNGHARICIDLLKRHTSDFELVVIDNNYGPGFNHAREMNRLLEICRTDYLVVMDDDVWVSAGWLNGLLTCLSPDVGLVVPQHYGRDGAFSFAGIVMRPDDTGRHSHIYSPTKTSVPTQTICSAVMLIDMAKIGHLRVDESYSKYFLDIDYGLRVWEAGFRVMVSADSTCTHLGGATLAYGSELSDKLNENQRQQWVRDWIPTGRFNELVRTIWSKVPELQPILKFPEQLKELLIRRPGESVDEFIVRAMPSMNLIQSIPAMLGYVEEVVVNACEGRFVGVYDEKCGHLMLLHAMCGAPHLINSDWEGFDIYLSGDRFYALATGAQTPQRSQLLLNDSGGSAADTLSNLRAQISRGLVRTAPASTATPHAIQPSTGGFGAKLVLEGFFGFNIVKCEERFYGLPQSEGAFDLLRARHNGYRDLVIKDSILEVKRAVLLVWMVRTPARAVKASLRRLTGRPRRTA